MKFAKEMMQESIPEWRRAYIDYSGLKKKLKSVEKTRKSNEQTQAHKLHQTLCDQGSIPQEWNAEINFSQTHKEDMFIPSTTHCYENPVLSCDKRSTVHQRSFILSQPILRRLSSRFMRGNPDSNQNALRTENFPSYFGAISVLDRALLKANDAERSFFHMLDSDLDKISLFYNEKETEAKAKLEALKTQVRLIAEFGLQLSGAPINDKGHTPERKLNPLNWIRNRPCGKMDVECLPLSVKYDHQMSHRVARSRFKKAFTEYYRSLELLKSYRHLNQIGFRKILKKFDKMAGWRASGLYMQKVKYYHWIISKDLDDIIRVTENLFVTEFADGHRRGAMTKLRVVEKNQSYTATTWRTGFYLGVSAALFHQVYLLVSEKLKTQPNSNIEYNLQIYSCFALPILFCLGFAVNVLVWHQSRVNYKFIFELNPRNNLGHDQFAELPAFMLLILSAIMYIDFSDSFTPTISSELYPLILLSILLSIAFCPFKIMYYSARKWLGVTLARIFFSFFYSVEFRDFFIADELNSLVYSFWTISYFFCAYQWHWDGLDDHCSVMKMWISPFLASIPPWWRLLQCIRRFKDSNERVHVQNGFKYVTSIMASMATGIRRIHSPLWMQVVWIIACVVNSSYTSVWDIKMDWGLLKPNSCHFLLRNDIVFYKWTYYVAVIINVALRFAWTLNLANLSLNPQLLIFILALVEAYRRLQWNFFRLENEHLNNCGAYCAIKEIPLPFALMDTMKPPGHEQERQEQQGVTQSHIELDRVATSPTLQGNMPFHPPQHSTDISVGTFYGRRDFENRHEDGELEEEIQKPTRHASLVLNTFDRIRNIRGSDTSSEGSDPEENDEEKLKEIHPITTGNIEHS